jgi:transposase-like protein
MVQGHVVQHPSQWAAIEALAPKLGCVAASLRPWVRLAERDAGQRVELPAPSGSG